MAKASNYQEITELTKIRDHTTDGDCYAFVVRCLADSPSAVDIRIYGFHGNGESVRIEPGGEQPFYSRSKMGDIWANTVTTGGAQISYGRFA